MQKYAKLQSLLDAFLNYKGLAEEHVNRPMWLVDMGILTGEAVEKEFFLVWDCMYYSEAKYVVRMFRDAEVNIRLLLPK